MDRSSSPERFGMVIVAAFAVLDFMFEGINADMAKNQADAQRLRDEAVREAANVDESRQTVLDAMEREGQKAKRKLDRQLRDDSN
jgi:hypothetical protein